jgi:SSS family solute:Na+ symporter
VLFIVGGCLLAPQLDDPKFGGVFQFIQQFQGYIWPGVVAVFLFGILVETAPGAAGVAGLLAGPAIYHLFQTCAKEIHFLVQVTLTFSLVLALMSLITFFAPAKPKVLPERPGLDLRTEPVVHWCGWGVIVAVVLLVLVFR